MGRFRRRTFLGSTIATALGVLGYGESDSAPDEAVDQHAASEPRQPPPGDVPIPPHDHSGPQQGGSTVFARELLHRSRVTSSHASPRRPIISTEPRELFVDPRVGNDGNDGSRGAPLRTIHEALERVPIIVQHPHAIRLADGTYEGRKPVSGVVHFAGGTHDPHPMVIRGNPEDPSAVVIDNNVMLSARSNEMDNALLRDVTITGSLQNINSQFQVKNIRFAGTAGETVIDGAAFKTHDTSSTILRNCEFSATYDTAADVSLGATVMLDGCVGTVGGHAIDADRGALAIDIGPNDLTGREGYVTTQRGARYVTEDGSTHAGSDRP